MGVTPARSSSRRSGGGGSVRQTAYSRVAGELAAARLAGATQLDDVGPVSLKARRQKAFGVIWNEIVESWRLEDIINFAERDMLHFNELPSLTDVFVDVVDWDTVKSHRSAALWDKSSVRLPVFVFCDEISKFLKKFENYSAGMDSTAKKIKSQNLFARNFFLSTFCPKSAELKSSLHLVALREVVESLFIYIARSFPKGHELVDGINRLWLWISDDPNRFSWISGTPIAELKLCLIKIFTAAQRVDVLGTDELPAVVESHENLRRLLTRLIRVPTDKLMSQRMQLPEPIQNFLSLATGCLDTRILHANRDHTPLPIFGTSRDKVKEINRIFKSEQSTICTPFFSQCVPPLSQQESAVPLHLVSQISSLFGLEGTEGIRQNYFSFVGGAAKLFYRRALRLLTAASGTLGTSEAKRRIRFFVNSILMEIPESPNVTEMVSMCILTPYYREDAAIDLNDLFLTTPEGVTKFSLLTSLHGQEFSNFLERCDPDSLLIKLNYFWNDKLRTAAASAVQSAKSKFYKNLLKDNKLDSFLRMRHLLQDWASCRGQVLSRTVRGMFYIEQALQIQLYLDNRSYSEVNLPTDSNRLSLEQTKIRTSATAGLWAEALAVPPAYRSDPDCQGLSQIKFQYVVAAQEFGVDVLQTKESKGDKAAGFRRKMAIIELAKKFRNLRISTLEADVDRNGTPTGRKVSVLYRYRTKLSSDPAPKKISSKDEIALTPKTSNLSSHIFVEGLNSPVPNEENTSDDSEATIVDAVSQSPDPSSELEVVYRIVLPTVTDANGRPWGRYPIIGPGKPENQNHSVIFTRGEVLQAIDMNMDGYLEESIKIRNLLQEFTRHPRMRILGFREHIFTQEVSSISSYMGLQESSFVTNNQRLYHKPLCVRMHYGHPDLFDRYFVQSCGGMSKASNGINLSEDVFAGFNATERGFEIRHVDYIQVGKGRDVGLQQICLFERKVASGNAEQMLSRDVYRLLSGMDYFRTLSVYFTGPGFFFNSVLMIFSAFVLMYCKVYLAVQHEISIDGEGDIWLTVLQPIRSNQLQLGMFLVISILLQSILEHGIAKAGSLFVDLILKFSVAYYTFMIGTKSAAVDHVLMYGGAAYQETGRGFAVAHVNLVDLWKFYFSSHLLPAAELFFILLIYGLTSDLNFWGFVGDTWPIWIVVFSFAWSPFVFNPLGLYYVTLTDDLRKWQRWISDVNGWDKWWANEIAGREVPNVGNKILIIIRLCRFFFLSWVFTALISARLVLSDVDVFVLVFAIFGIFVSMLVFLSDCKLADPTVNRLLLCCLVIGSLSAVTASLILGWTDVVSLVLGLGLIVSTCYGVLEISSVLAGRWASDIEALRVANRLVHLVVGHLTVLPLVVLAAITTSFHEIQTRVLFNPKFVDIVKVAMARPN